MTLRHWDGSRWRRLPAGHSGGFAAVDADGPANAWAVGGGAFDEPVALHWDGRSWRRHRSPIKARDVAVEVRGDAQLGEVDILGRSDDGRHARTSVIQAGKHVLILDTHVGIGQVRVTRAAR